MADKFVCMVRILRNLWKFNEKVVKQRGKTLFENATRRGKSTKRGDPVRNRNIRVDARESMGLPVLS
jgi:hypothetical protein